MNARDILVEIKSGGRDSKIETVKIGTLGKGRLCKIVESLYNENNKLRNGLNQVYLAYSNHIASNDALSKEESMEILNEPK